MDYERAKGIGDEGERLVSEMLGWLAPKYDFVLLDDLLLQAGSMTTQIDHLIVDRHGLLVVESKVRHGAVILGSDVEKRWTACYGGRKNKAFQNPLVQNRHHEDVLRKALLSLPGGCPIEAPLLPDYVKSVVVFVEADVSKLALSELERAKVKRLEEIEEYLLFRRDFAVVARALTPGEVAGVVDALRELDRRGDPRVEAKHRRSAIGRHVERIARDPVVQLDTTAVSRRMPAPISPTRRRSGSLVIRPGNLLAGALCLGLVWWLGWMGGWDTYVTPTIARFLAPTTASAPPGAPQTPATPASQPSLAVAKAALKQYAPKQYPLIAELDRPKVAGGQGIWVFRWTYVEKSGQSAARVRSVSLTLDGAGNFQGLEYGR